MKRHPVLLCVFGLTVSPLSLAQPAPAPNPPGAAIPAAPPEEGAEPRMPDVNDPMLSDVPAAPNVVNNWQQALRMIRARASALRIANAQIDQASGQSRQALSRALPNLTASASLTHHLLYGTGVNLSNLPEITETTIPDPGTNWQANLGLRVPIIAAQAWHDYGTAKAAVQAARLSAKEAQRIVLAQTAEAIVNVVTSERLSEVSRVSLRSALSTLDLNRRRAELGASSLVDVLRTEQEVSLARAQVVSADENLRRARELLGEVFGSNEPWSVTPGIRLDALAAEAGTTCRPERTVDTRPDIQAAQANLRIAERNVDSIDWSYTPTVDFVSNLTYLPRTEISPNREHVTWTIGGVLTWQLYDGGFRYGARESNEGQVRVAREQLTQAKRQAQIQVSQTFRGVRVAEANLAVSRRSRYIASESARLSKIGFLNGSNTSFDLVDTARRLREAEIDLTIKEFEVVRAKVSALLALATCNV